MRMCSSWFAQHMRAFKKVHRTLHCVTLLSSTHAGPAQCKEGFLKHNNPRDSCDSVSDIRTKPATGLDFKMPIHDKCDADQRIQQHCAMHGCENMPRQGIVIAKKLPEGEIFPTLLPPPAQTRWHIILESAV